MFFIFIRHGYLSWQNMKSYLIVSAVMGLFISLFGFVKAITGYAICNAFTIAGLVSLYVLYKADEPLKAPLWMLCLFISGILSGWIIEFVIYITGLVFERKAK